MTGLIVSCNASVISLSPVMVQPCPCVRHASRPVLASRGMACRGGTLATVPARSTRGERVGHGGRQAAPAKSEGGRTCRAISPSAATCRLGPLRCCVSCPVAEQDLYQSGLSAQRGDQQ